jgi:hypothetical protein
MALKLQKTTVDARRQAAAVLEVLAGARTPGEAATSLGLSVPAYYKLEARALQGMVFGCQPVGRGPKSSPEAEVRRLRRQCEQLIRDLRRYQALARSAQRAAGLTAPAAVQKDARGRRKRKPAVRALKAAETMRCHADGVSAPATQSGTLMPDATA